MSSADEVAGETSREPAGNGRRTEDPGRELLVMRLGEARFGLWIDEVLEIVATPPISRLPLPVKEVAGVTGIRGDVVPVLDLGMRLLGEPTRRPGRLVVVRHEESGSVVALLVDAVETLASVRMDEMGDAPEEVTAALPPAMVSAVVVRPGGVITILRLEGAAAPPAASTEEEE